MTNVLVAVVLFCAACTDPAEPTTEGTSRVNVFWHPSYGPRQLDVLFIIDDTAAMAPYQERMTTLPAALTAAFVELNGGLLDTRIAVATTTSPELRGGPSVGAPFMTIRTEFDLVRVTNFLGSFEDTFRELAAVGATSTLPNRPLETLRAIAEQDPAGLLRDNAPLAVVIITASDDASLDAPSAYVEATRWSKPDPSNVFVSAIKLDGTPRLDAALAALPNRHSTTALADGDYKHAIDVFNVLIKTILPGTCWYASDIDPVTPGPQYDCTFTATIRGAERVLPPCKLPTDQLCWTLVSSERECSEPGRVKPHIPPYRYFTFVPPIRAECVTLE